ncbi:putative lipid A export ATP-binding/permease protein MsbA [Mycoplasma sp. CAG:956]|nr:putative lipid A export ATP-binding/permease protein MsbA [Mycoplasma sp. CAG:956]
MENDNFKLNVKRTWKYIKEAKLNLIGYGIVSIIEAIISAIIPLLAAKVILNITNGIINQLILSAIVVFIIELILYVMIYFKGFFYQKIYQKTLIAIQKSLTKEILNLEVQEIDKNSSGLFINRLNKDTQDIAGLFMEYAYWLSYIITNVGVLVTIFILNKYLFIYAVITSLIVYFINRKSLAKQYEVQRKLKTIEENKTGLTSELVRGIRDIKILNASRSILKQAYNKIEDATNEQVHIMNIRRLYNYIESNIRALTDLGLILVGCLLYNKSLLSIPNFVIIYNYQAKVKNLLVGIVKIAEYNKKFSIAANRVYEVIENSKFAKEQFGNIKKDKLEGSIKFVDVSFSYDTEEILKKMNFTIKPNEKIAFVGKSGAGKSTIFNLITHLYQVSSGKVLLDDININDLDCNTIRNNMSIITQNPYIFNFSIKDNLLLAKEDATLKEIRNACRLACIDDYIMSLPDKYDTPLGENGIILSGGQKQRIAIARALLMQTEIILFDEATSALDNETQEQIQKAIDNLKGEYTILIIAHRLSTVIDADKIFVIDDGKIIDSGTHQELLKKCEFYKNLYSKDLHN